MKVRMLVSMAASNFSHSPGDVIDVRPDVAQAWEQAGIAVPVKAQAVEDEVIQAPETAAMARIKKTKR